MSFLMGAYRYYVNVFILSFLSLVSHDGEDDGENVSHDGEDDGENVGMKLR